MPYNWKKNTAIFLACQAFTLFGSSLVQHAITWHITLTTQSGVHATFIIICAFLPTFFLAPFAGVWADRYNRRLLIIIADASIAVCTLAMAYLFLSGRGALWMLFAGAGVRALGAAVQTPCVNAMLPDIVPEEHLTRVNGINGSLQSLIMLLSPMLSGALLGLASLESIFFVDVATAAVSIAVMLLLFRLPARAEQPKPAAGGGYFGEMREGLVYILGQPYLRNFFAFCALFFLLAAPVAFLTPLQIARTFGGDVWRLTAIELSFSVGMMLGGLLIAAWGGFKNRVHTMALAWIYMGAMTAGLGIPRYFWLYLLLMGLGGLSMPVFNTPALVLLQERVDPRYMGRVFGVLTMLSSSLMPIGMLLFGPLADRIAIEWLLIFTGALMMLLAGALFYNRPLLLAGARNPASPGGDEATAGDAKL